MIRIYPTTSFIIACIQSVVLAMLAVSAEAGQISLYFPLASSPYTSDITSVVDHSGQAFGLASAGSSTKPPDIHVRAYTGEMGRDVCGPSGEPCGYKNPSNNAFIVNGNYVGTSADGSDRTKVLNYRGHAGYDYPCSSGEPVYASAPGQIKYVNYDPVIYGNTAGGNAAFKIVHPNGYETWYLHTDPVNRINDGAVINAGDLPGMQVGTCSNKCVGGCGYHLHFEVRHNDKVIDPYGWEWYLADDLELHPQGEVNINPLWANIPVKPTISNITLTPETSGYSVSITGQDFTGSEVTLWHRQSEYFDEAITPSAITSTSILAFLPISNPGDYILKVGQPGGPRSNGVRLPVLTTDTSVPIHIIGQPAPGGGEYVSFAEFADANLYGDVFFNAEIDSNGDGISDGAKLFRRTANVTNVYDVSGISKVGTLRVNNAGTTAFGDASIPGRTQAIYYLEPGSTVPVKIAEWDDPSPIAGLTYFDIRGPLAVNDSGDIVFSSSLYDDATSTVYCCYVFQYSRATDTTFKVVAKNDGPTPLGGTFNISFAPAVEVADDGDVVFESSVVGGSSTMGIFRYDKQSGQIYKVVASGDTAPVSVGGSITNPSFRYRGLSGKRLVFQSELSGTTPKQAIFVKEDINNSSLNDIKTVVYEGQPTNTPAGGLFAHQNYPSGLMPFSLTGDPPRIRNDSAVMFHSLLKDATNSAGQAADDGIFMWTGRDFKKVVVEGDVISTGTIHGVSAHMLNDSGHVFYFAAGIN